MKYLNSLVFLGLMVMVAGCQKKEKAEPKKGSHHTSAHDAKAAKGHKQGPTKLETKKSAMHKDHEKKDHEKKSSHYTSAHDAREAKGEKLGFTKLESKNSSMHKDAHKKAAPKKDHDKKNKKSGNMN